MRWVDRLLLAVAALVALANLLPLGARLTWILDLTTHFRVQYLAATVLMLALLAVRRRWLPCAALVVTGIVSAWPVLPYLPRTLIADAGATTEAPIIKLITVNVSFRQFSPRRLLEAIAEENPDIVVVQELTPHAERVLADLDVTFPDHRKFAVDGPTGIGLWSRLPLVSSSLLTLGRAPALEAKVLSPAGMLTIIGVHLRAPVAGLRAGVRNQQLRLLAARSTAVDTPLVVAGDFNITPYSPYFADWLAESGLTDSRRGRTLSPSWPTMLPWFAIPIDHVAVNDAIEILSHRRLPNFESDHYGVVVELALRAPAEVPHP